MAERNSTRLEGTYNAVPHKIGKYVLCAEDLLRANKLSCMQKVIKRAKFEKYMPKYTTIYGDHTAKFAVRSEFIRSALLNTKGANRS